MELLNLSLEELEREYPFVSDLLRIASDERNGSHTTLKSYIDSLRENDFEDLGMDKEKLLEHLNALEKSSANVYSGSVKSISILGGHDKSGRPEEVEILLEAGSITSIVGPTGSGKSRLLADIEWMAQNDTPTGRRILLNGERPDPKLRLSPEHKLVAQLSQNMNFVMDTSVAEFIAMHAESRSIRNSGKVVEEIIVQANLLAGEPFKSDTPVTALSGGQSRALMIADTAFLSLSPVVLIDEIENAGIDRKKALGLLVRKEKIVLIATHDPILALMASQRLVIKNGGIHKILKTSQAEKDNLEELQTLDNKLLSLRNRLRNGEQLSDLLSVS
jgi:ABC-type lipoprotein export system ATPase subunit